MKKRHPHVLPGARPHCPSCGMAECDRYHPYFDTERPVPENYRNAPNYDPHWVLIDDLKHIIEKYRQRGDLDVVAVYEEILRNVQAR